MQKLCICVRIIISISRHFDEVGSRSLIDRVTGSDCRTIFLLDGWGSASGCLIMWKRRSRAASIYVWHVWYCFLWQVLCLHLCFGYWQLISQYCLYLVFVVSNVITFFLSDLWSVNIDFLLGVTTYVELNTYEIIVIQDAQFTDIKSCSVQCIAL